MLKPKAHQDALIVLGLFFLVACGAGEELFSPLPAPGPSAVATPAPAAPVRALAPRLVLELDEEYALSNLFATGAGTAPGEGFTWSSSDGWVAPVNPHTGVIRARAVGLAIVTVESPGGHATIEVQVTDRLAVEEVMVRPARLVMRPGDRLAMTADVHTKNGEINGDVVWSSSDATVATINPTTGEVVALRAGDVTLKAAFRLSPKAFGLAELRVSDYDDAAAPGPKPALDRSGPETALGLTAAAFPTARIGYLASNPGRLWKTLDGGATWHEITPSTLRNRPITHMAFDTADSGLVVAGNEVFRTMDGGKTWQLALRTGVPLTSLVQGTGGFLAADSTGLVRTSESGQSGWSALLDRTLPPVTSLLAGDGGVYALAGGELFRLGADETLTRLMLPAAHAASVQAQQLAIAGERALMLLTPSGQLARTTDGGQTWDELPIVAENGAPFVADASTMLAFRDAATGMVVTGERAYWTRDGGHTWRELELDLKVTEIPRQVVWDPAGYAWLIGSGGMVMRLGPL